MLSHPRLIEWYTCFKSVNHGKTHAHSHCLMMKKVQSVPWQSDQWFTVQEMVQDVGISVRSSCIILTENLAIQLCVHNIQSKTSHGLGGE